ncbi:aromatic ring-hydroxylating dioxygenase subunit alpha [soil metagenome]
MFIRNAWYVAAWPEEVSTKPMARTLLGEPVVLYRQEDGTPVALEDRCSHRNLPLSMGEVSGQYIVCAYHGLAYGADGKCARVPAQDTIPSAAKVKSYPLVERDGALWIWMGDAELADPDGIVPYPWHSDPGWAHKHSYYHIDGQYQLLHENLLDLSHVGWVHRKTIGGTPNAHSQATMKTDRNGETVTVRRYMPNSVAPPTYVRAVGFTGDIDRWMKIEFFPTLIRVYTGANDVGKGVDEAHQMDTFGARIFNGVTPETEHTTHYFWSAAHNYKVDQPEVTEQFFREVEATFIEDKTVMEAQYQRMRQLPTARTFDIRSDLGGAQARKVIAIKLEAEAQS